MNEESSLIARTNEKVYSSFDQLPLVMSAEDVAAVLNISRAKAYQLLHTDTFPTLKIDKRLLVPKERFLIWMNTQLSN